jgi:hypothetical protein
VKLSGAVPGVYRQWLSNLFEERNLRPSDWDEIVTTVCAQGELADVTTVSNACRALFRRLLAISPGLRGPLATCPTAVLGRAVSRTTFEQLLQRRMGGSASAARSVIRELIDRTPSDYEAEWRAWPIGDHLIWATFSDDAAFEGPFSGLPADRRKLRCALGLPWDDGQLILLTYSVSSDITLFIPTIVEAYAANGWTVHFRPSPGDEPFGRTMPHPECSQMVGAPEVVHRPTMFASLTEAVAVI